jgi:NADH-quinone oxidoreductase subunit K
MVILNILDNIKASLDSLMTEGPGLHYYLMISAIMFALGIGAIVYRRNAVAILMGIELVLNAAAINFVAFSHFSRGQATLDGQIFAIFIIMLAAAEAAVGLAIVLNLFNLFNSVETDNANLLKG